MIEAKHEESRGISRRTFLSGTATLHDRVKFERGKSPGIMLHLLRTRTHSATMSSPPEGGILLERPIPSALGMTVNTR